MSQRENDSKSDIEAEYNKRILHDSPVLAVTLYIQPSRSVQGVPGDFEPQGESSLRTADAWDFSSFEGEFRIKKTLLVLSVCGGGMQVQNCPDSRTFLRLWCHENMRVFADRLIDQQVPRLLVSNRYATS